MSFEPRMEMGSWREGPTNIKWFDIWEPHFRSTIVSSHFLGAIYFLGIPVKVIFTSEVPLC